MSPEFRPLLEARRAELVARLRTADDQLDQVTNARTDSTSDDEHDPEGSTLSSDWSRIYGLRDASVGQLAATDAALARIADGSYGTCLRCGRPIAPDRLRARPEAETCIECARLIP